VGGGVRGRDGPLNCYMELNSFWDSVEENPFTIFLDYIYKQINLHISSNHKQILLHSLMEIDALTKENLDKLETIMEEANQIKKNLVSGR